MIYNHYPHSELQVLPFHHIGDDSIIKGDLKIPGSFYFSGRFEGSLEMPGDGFFALAASAYFQGKITAGHVIIEGTFDGEIISSGKVEIRSCAVVSGKLTCDKIQIAPGAVIETQTSTLTKTDDNEQPQ